MIRKTLVIVLLVLIAAVNLSAQTPDVATNRYFVGFADVMTNSDISFLRDTGVQLGRSFPEIQATEVIVRSDTQVAAIQRNLRVEYIEAVPMRYADDLNSAQLAPSLTNGLYGLITTKAVDAHNLSITGSAVKVGVADTGIDCNHVDIARNLVQTIDMVGTKTHGGCWATGELQETHATHVAGTILGVFNNAGIYGVAYNATLYHARVLGPNGGTAAEVMDGVRWLVVTSGVRVVNLSLGGGFPSLAELRFYAQMRRRGALIVAAAGNDGRRRISYPAAYGSNIAVGAVDKDSNLASFSNTGRNLGVVAPGVGILSSVPAGTGSEAAVSTRTTYAAFGVEFAGKPPTGITGNLVNCGLIACPASVFGNIALFLRGTSTIAEKVKDAMTKGATAAIIYNNAPGAFQATFSTPTNNGLTWVPTVTVSDVAGADLLTQLGNSALVSNVASSWDTFSGTSMATPHVTGTIALMWSAAPNLANSTIEIDLYATCTDLGVAGYDTIYGYGLINALAAVQKVLAP